MGGLRNAAEAHQRDDTVRATARTDAPGRDSATARAPEPSARAAAMDETAAGTDRLSAAVAAEIDNLAAKHPPRSDTQALDLAAVDGSEPEVDHADERSYWF